MKFWRRAITWLILTGLLSVQGAVWVAAVHASAEDDAACASLDGPQVVVGPHHQDGAQFEETNAPNPIEHCALCHMERAAHGARFTRIETLHLAAHVVAGPVDVAVRPALVVVRTTAPRGPPSTSL